MHVNSPRQYRMQTAMLFQNKGLKTNVQPLHVLKVIFNPTNTTNLLLKRYIWTEKNNLEPGLDNNIYHFYTISEAGCIFIKNSRQVIK